MLSRRTLTLAILFLTPLLVYLGLGAYALWQTGWFAWTFWIIPGCWLITWIVATVWRTTPPSVEEDLPEPRHFTPRDEQAMAIVRQYQEQVNSLGVAQLTDPMFYFEQSLKLSGEIARHYHPTATDPVDSLAVTEVLAAARLALDDMERWMLEAVPGSRLVTIRQWKWLQHAPRWVKRAQDVTWLASIFVNPANILKYATSAATLGPVTQELQTEFLAAIYLRFIRQTGFYLVEMNSGRLKGGADLYRTAFGTPEQQAFSPGALNQPRLKPESVTVALIGQVKAGKSSLVNALIGQEVARSDVLPETQHVSRYRLVLPEEAGELTLLDTPGYADAGATRDQIQEVKQAARDADVLLLVMAANSPARSADRAVMDELQRWDADHPEFRPAPVIICLTHIDLLSPMMEWSPPYDWRNPTSKKARSLHDAVEHVKTLFQDVTSAVVPVCTDVKRGRAAQIVEELVPALLEELPDGKTAALLKAYHRKLSQDRLKTVFQQLRKTGTMLLQNWLDERLPHFLPPDQKGRQDSR